MEVSNPGLLNSLLRDMMVEKRGEGVGEGAQEEVGT